jgi:AcrR family transcriptional regulator
MPENRPRASAALASGLSAGRARADQISGGNHGLTPEQVASSQRGRVLAALREELAERPLNEVPVAAVIARAGVSRKTFYEHWASKEDCFVALYEHELGRLVEPALRAFEGGEPWVDRLRTALGVLLGALAADPLAARICFVDALAAGPSALAARNAAMATLDPLFDAGNVTTAAGSPRPRAVTAGAIGYLTETLNREIAAGRAERLPELRAELMYALTLPFVGRPGATRELELDGSDAALHPDAATERAFLMTYGAAAADMLGRVGAAMAASDDPAGRVRAGVGALLELCADEPAAARACIVEALSVGPAARARRAETTERLADLFAEPLRELRPSERIARVSALALVGGFHELVFDAVDRRATGELPPLDAVVAIARLDSDHVA